MSGFYYNIIIQTPPESFNAAQLSEPIFESIRVFYPNAEFKFFLKEDGRDSYELSFWEKELWLLLDKDDFENAEAEKFLNGWFHLEIQKMNDIVQFISIIDGDSTTTQLLSNDFFVDLIIKQFKSANLIEQGLWAYDLDYDSYEEALTEKINDPAVQKVFT